MTGMEPTVTDAELLRALESGVALIDRSDAGRVEVSGPDRAALLHNLTTNDVKALKPGRGVEAFVTSPQGRTLGLVTLLAAPERIHLRVAPGGLELVLPHLRKYGALDDAEIDDATGRTFELHLVGPKAGVLLQKLGAEPPPEGDLAHIATSIAGHPVLIARESPTVDPGLTIVGARADESAVTDAIAEAGAPFGLARMAPDQFESLRIEAGTPKPGRDFTDANLPQELGRDSRAISFVKGCYLGQETVARLDALGHVNKLLRGLRFDSGTPPAPGSKLFPEGGDGREVGTLTSASRSLRGGGAIGLAIVRTSHVEEGTRLVCDADGLRVAAVVAELPIR